MLNVTLLKDQELVEKQALFLGSNFMQTFYWASIKEEYGFKAYFFQISLNGRDEGLVVLQRPLKFGFSLAYIPHGPSVTLSETIDFIELSKKLRPFLPGMTLFIRYDLLLSVSRKDRVKGLKKSTVTVQVPDTSILDIKKSEDELLSGMHKKTRYNIKLAEKKGVVISDTPLSSIDEWYNLYEVTAKRDSIAIHSREYYKSVVNKVSESDSSSVKLLLAHHDGELLAGIIIIIQKDMATYLYGASSNSKRNLMPAYLLQWYGIKISRSLGAKQYDFFGIPPVNDENHPMYGLYRFKVGFGGEIINRLGCYDYYLSPLSYLFNLMERARNFYYKRLKK